MRRFVIMLAAAVVVALAGALAALAEKPEPTAEATGVRVGTFDSRAIALVYYRSAEHLDHIKSLKKEYAAAKEAGDEERARELQAEGEGSQALAHKQGFGTWPVDELLARIEDEIPAIAEAAGVDVIVSKWDLAYARPGIACVDVTLAMVRPFDPDEATLRLIRDELPQHEPVPLAELESHEH